MWYKRLREFLLKLGLKESYTDPSLFILFRSGETMYLFTYVDDIVVTWFDQALVQKVVDSMGREFALRDLSYFCWS